MCQRSGGQRRHRPQRRRIHQPGPLFGLPATTTTAPEPAADVVELNDQEGAQHPQQPDRIELWRSERLQELLRAKDLQACVLLLRQVAPGRLQVDKTARNVLHRFVNLARPTLDNRPKMFFFVSKIQP